MGLTVAQCHTSPWVIHGDLGRELNGHLAGGLALGTHSECRRDLWRQGDWLNNVSSLRLS